MTAPSGPGDFAALNAGDGKSKNWFEQASGRGSSMVGAGQDVADASSPPEWGVAAVSARAEQLELLMNPTQQLTNNGLGFLVSIVMSPVVELAEWAFGDPEQMRSTGEGWEKVAKWLDQVAEQEKGRAQSTAQTWIGKDGDAFRRQMAEFGDGVTALAQDVRGLKETLDGIADLFDMIVEFFVQMVTELVIGLIIQWLAALAASWVTAGASVAAAGATTTVQVGATGVRITTRVTKLQAELYKMFQRIERLLQKLRETGKLQRVIQETNKLRDGGMVKQYLGRKIDSNAAVKFVTRADAEDFASQGGQRFVRNAAESDWYKDAEKNLDDRIAQATRDRDNETAQALQQQKDNLPTDVKGVQGLANNAASHVLSGVLGGQTSWGRAATAAGVEVGTDAAIDQGAKSIYDEGRGVMQGDLSDQQIDQAQERGFQ